MTSSRSDIEVDPLVDKVAVFLAAMDGNDRVPAHQADDYESIYRSRAERVLEIIRDGGPRLTGDEVRDLINERDRAWTRLHRVRAVVDAAPLVTAKYGLVAQMGHALDAIRKELDQ